MKVWLKKMAFGGTGIGTTQGDIVLLIFRLTIGLQMAIAHGWDKLYSDHQFGVSPQAVAMVRSMGFPAPHFFAWCSALSEFLCAILIGIGLLTRPASFILAFNMAVATFVALKNADWFGGYRELAMIYFAASLLLMFIGAGRVSVDRLIRGK